MTVIKGLVTSVVLITLIGCGGSGDRASIQRGSVDVEADVAVGMADEVLDEALDEALMETEIPQAVEAPVCAGVEVDGVCSERAACTGTPTDEQVSMYRYKRSLTINHQLVGTDNAGTLPASGFPLLVKLQGSWLHTRAIDSDNGKIESQLGHDIVFTAGDGATRLAHDLEAYSAESGALTAWVRVDALSKATDTTMYMYYGNDCLSTPTTNQTVVWDNGFKGVWHLNEDPGAAGANGIKDATANNHNGTPMGGLSVADSVAGIAGKSIIFSQQDSYINFGDVDAFDFGLGNFTVSGWIKGNQTWSVLASKSADAGPYDGIYIYSSRSRANWTWWGSGANDDQYAQFNPVSMDGDWHHLVVVREGTGANQLKVYTDGVLTTSALEDSNLSNNRDFMIHRWDDFPATAGTQIDEVRVSNTSRSYDWIRTSYNNQSNPGGIGTPGFYSVGQEEAVN